jgi:hypothetical protein
MARSWFLSCIFPHLLVITLGSIGALVIPSPILKLIVLFFSIIVILTMICCRHLLEILYRSRCRDIHQLNHFARDMIIRVQNSPYAYYQPMVRGRPTANPILEGQKAEIINLMETVVSLFEAATSGKRIWMTLRELRRDHCYHTFARAGRYNAAREQNSLPLHRAKSATIRRLHDSLDNQHCVVMTGSTKSPEMWTPQPNDRFEEDKCVLMGAVLLKVWDPPAGFKRSKLVWIIAVCSDRENAFDASHISLMQACVDVFSMIANVMARSPKRRIECATEIVPTCQSSLLPAISEDRASTPESSFSYGLESEYIQFLERSVKRIDENSKRMAESSSRMLETLERIQYGRG